MTASASVSTSAVAAQTSPDGAAVPDDGFAPLRLPDTGGVPVGAWLVLALVSASLGILVLRRRRARAEAVRDRGGWRLDAEREIASLRALAPAHADELLARASVLARRVALVAAPRTEIAALEGDAWLRALDGLARNRDFTEGPGRLLATGPYRREAAVSVAEREALLDALTRLVATLSSPATATADAGAAPVAPAGEPSR